MSSVLHEVMETSRIAAFAQDISMQLQLRTTMMTGTETHLQRTDYNATLCIPARTNHQDCSSSHKLSTILAPAPMVRDDLEWPTPAGSQGAPSKPIEVILSTSKKEVNGIRGVIPGRRTKMDAGVFFSDVRASCEHASLL